MNTSYTLIVTGAAGILGQAFIAAALTNPRIGQIIATCRSEGISDIRGATCTLSGVDLATELGVEKLANYVAEIAPNRAILIHAVGHFSGFAPLHQVSLDTVRETFDANVVTFVGATAAVLPIMREQRWGRIIAFSAKTRDEDYPFMGSFNLAKAALESVVHTLANENARFGISANTVRLATLRTEVERAIKPTGDFDGWLDPARVASTTLEIALGTDVSLNGSNLELWNYSDSFFGRSMLERNSLILESVDPDEADRR